MEISLGTKLPMSTEISLLSLYFYPMDKYKSTLLNVIIPPIYARSTESFVFASRTPCSYYYADLGNYPWQRFMHTVIFCSVVI